VIGTSTNGKPILESDSLELGSEIRYNRIILMKINDNVVDDVEG